MKKLLLSIVALAMFAAPNVAQADRANISTSLVGVQGYDLVSYHQDGPTRGTGTNVSTHGGVTYLFSSKENLATFEANPEKYIPAYGGYCAYGVAVGKKFVADPTVWKVVDGTLYLNLDQKVSAIWQKDIPGNIKTADTTWPTIEGKAPSEL